MKNFVIMLLLIFFAVPAMAVPIDISVEIVAGNQDPYDEGWTHELGNGFPADELISSSDEFTELIACPIDYGDGQNFLVTMTNLSGEDWTNVAYVADLETSITNDDQFLVNGQQAFYIDNIGLNSPLVYESMAYDNVFAAGETWRFIIQEYTNGNSLAASAFASWDNINTLGLVGSQSSSDVISSGSIIVVPEPATMLLLGLGGLVMRRRRG